MSKKEPQLNYRTNKDGKYLCHGNCRSWDLGICTCGLYSEISFHSLYKKDGMSNKIRRHQSDTISFLMYNPVERKTKCHHNIDLDEECIDCTNEMNEFLNNIFSGHII